MLGPSFLQEKIWLLDVVPQGPPILIPNSLPTCLPAAPPRRALLPACLCPCSQRDSDINDDRKPTRHKILGNGKYTRSLVYAPRGSQLETWEHFLSKPDLLLTPPACVHGLFGASSWASKRHLNTTRLNP